MPLTIENSAELIGHIGGKRKIMAVNPATKRVEVLRQFRHAGGNVGIGAVIDLPKAIANELVTSNKARHVDPTTPLIKKDTLSPPALAQTFAERRARQTAGLDQAAEDRMQRAMATALGDALERMEERISTKVEALVIKTLHDQGFVEDPAPAGSDGKAAADTGKGETKPAGKSSK